MTVNLIPSQFLKMYKTFVTMRDSGDISTASPSLLANGLELKGAVMRQGWWGGL